MTKDQIRIGARVVTTVDFAGVVAGVEGVIDEDYGTGVTVAWDLPSRPLPAGYPCEHHWTDRPLRDGFDKERELHFLEIL